MSMMHYTTDALRTALDKEGEAPPLWYLALGLAGEAGEVAELIKKFERHGKTLTREEVTKELGDVLWYATVLGHAAGRIIDGTPISLVEIANENTAKLKERYPTGFYKRGDDAGQ